MSASLVPNDTREVLKSRQSLDLFVTALQAVLGRQDIAVSSFDETGPSAALTVGRDITVYIQEGYVRARSYNRSDQREVDRVTEAVKGTMGSTARRLVSERTVSALRQRYRVKSDERVGTVRLVKLMAN